MTKKKQVPGGVGNGTNGQRPSTTQGNGGSGNFGNKSKDKTGGSRPQKR